MITWNRGRRIYSDRVASLAPPLDVFLRELDTKLAARVPGAGVFLASPSVRLPLSLIHYVGRIRVLPETVVILTVDILHAPHAAQDAMHLETLGKGLVRLTIDRGFMDTANLPVLLERAIARYELPIDPREVTYCAGRETFLATSAGRMGALSEGLFAFLARNARSATTHFCIPPEQVIEIGSQIDL